MCTTDPNDLNDLLNIADPSQQSEGIVKNVYRLGHSDIWACNNCKQRGDKWFMQKHLCRGSSVNDKESSRR